MALSPELLIRSWAPFKFNVYCFDEKVFMFVFSNNFCLSPAHVSLQYKHRVVDALSLSIVS